MAIQQEVIEIVEKMASITETIQSKISWLVMLGVLASAYLAWLLYSSDSANWWNGVKLFIVLLPALIWAFIWYVLGQIKQAPVALEAFKESAETLSFSQQDVQKQTGLRGLFRLIRYLHQHQGVEVVTEIIGSVTLLANPLFAIFAGIMLVFLIVFILVAPLLLLVF